MSNAKKEVIQVREVRWNVSEENGRVILHLSSSSVDIDAEIVLSPEAAQRLSQLLINGAIKAKAQAQT